MERYVQNILIGYQLSIFKLTDIPLLDVCVGTWMLFTVYSLCSRLSMFTVAKLICQHCKWYALNKPSIITMVNINHNIK